MSTIWSPSTGAEVDQTLAKLHYCLGPDQRDDESEGYSGFLCGAWDLRLLLLEMGVEQGAADPHGPWPHSWFERANGPVIAGLRLQAERWQPRREDLDDLDERLEGVGAICLWLGDGAVTDERARLIIDLVERANQRGLSVLASGPRSVGHDPQRAEMLDLSALRGAYLGERAGGESAGRLPPRMRLSPVKQLLTDLPSDQRFQARVAVLSALAWEMQQSGMELTGLERRRALVMGESLLIALSEATTDEWANETMVLLIAAVRARNTMDTRLRNMANDRLGLLVLLATARLGLRCRSFTVREICRELGAVATGT